MIARRTPALNPSRGGVGRLRRVAGMRADTSWMRRGACRGLPPEVFFPPDRDLRPARPWSPEEAQAVCARCPVADACRAWAVVTRQKDGVWGGLTEAELRRRQRQPRRRAS